MNRQVPLRRAGVDRAHGHGVGRAGAHDRRARLLHAVHARPLRRHCARADGRAAVRGRRHHDAAHRDARARQRLQAPGRGRQGSRHPRRAVRRPARVRARRRVDDRRLRSTRHAVRPPRRSHRAPGRSARGREGRVGRRRVRLRRRALHDHRVRRAAEAAAAAASADPRRAAAARRCCGSRGARPTSSASTPSSAPARSAPKQHATRSATRPRARSGGCAKARGSGSTSSSCRSATSWPRSPTTPQALAEAMAPAFGVDPSEALSSGGVLAGTVDEVCDTLRAPPGGVGRLVRRVRRRQLRAVRAGRGPPRRDLRRRARALFSSPTRTWLSW